jgi:hypothetical protein
MQWLAAHPVELQHVDAIAARAGYAPAAIEIAESGTGAAR